MRGRAVGHIDRPSANRIEWGIDHRSIICRINSKYAVVSSTRTQVATTTYGISNGASSASDIVHIRFRRE